MCRINLSWTSAITYSAFVYNLCHCKPKITLIVTALCQSKLRQAVLFGQLNKIDSGHLLITYRDTGLIVHSGQKNESVVPPNYIRGS